MSSSLLSDITAVVLDIEGTTTPMTFVKDKLFPYVRVNLRAYLEKNFDSKETQDDISSLRKQAEEDKNAGLEAVFPASPDSDREKIIDTVEHNVLRQMDLDRKTTALKQLQGHILQNGYGAGDIRGEVYDDVPCALKRLIRDGMKIYTYSSGSIGAQKLLFGYSEHGNLLELFSDQFDTTIGAKVEKESYARIAKAIDLSPEKILFLTDIPKEAEAARAAQFKTCLVIREGNAPLGEADQKSYPTVHSFDELFSSSTLNLSRCILSLLLIY